MDDGIFAEDRVEARLCKGQEARLDKLVSNLAPQAGFHRPPGRGFDKLPLDIDANNRGGAMFSDQGDVRAPHATAHIENSQAGDAMATQDSRNLRWAPR